jgi:hypothetical protein
MRWVRAGVRAGLISVPMVRARFATTRFLDADEEKRARQGLDSIKS